MESLEVASRGLGSRFWFPQIALRSYFPVEVGLGAPVEEMTELAGGETELEGTTVGVAGGVTSGSGGLLEEEGDGLTLELGGRPDEISSSSSSSSQSSSSSGGPEEEVGEGVGDAGGLDELGRGAGVN